VTRETLEEALRHFIGDIQQLPPMYSALKYQGKPYYHYARKGLSVPRMPRAVTIHSFSLLSFHPPSWEARVVCSRGTYVRTLIEDVSESLKTYGTLTDLIRERIGPYRNDQALTWQELRMISRENLLPLLQPVLAPEAAAHA
jgi:tRNA pseudouridine55 synthase